MSRKFEIEDIENDDRMQKFFKKKKKRSKSTLDSYLYAWKKFCNFIEKTPTEIFDIQRKELREKVPEFDWWLTEVLDNYVAYLIESNENYSYGTIELQIRRIKGLLHAFRVKTPKVEIDKDDVREDFKYALTVDDIRKAIIHSSPTYQTLFITQAQTGLSLSDALLLDVEDFIIAVSKKNEDLTLREAINRVRNDDNIIGCFDLRRKKTKIQFYTFAGPEVLKRIASLLESRSEEFLKPESPIFMKDTSRLRKEGKDHLLADLRLNHIVVDNYIHRMHITKKIFPRIEVDGKERNYFRSHKLRKWFASQLKNVAGIERDDAKFLMGQKTGDVIERYSDPNNYTNLKNNYRKTLPHLAINEEVVMEENQEAIEKLEMDNKRLQEQMQKREEQHRIEMEELKAQINQSQTKTDEFQKTIMDMLQSGEISPSEIDFETENEKMSYFKKRFPNKKIS